MNIPDILPSNSSKSKVEFNIHTYGTQNGWIIGRSKNEPSDFQLFEGIFFLLFRNLRCFSSNRMLGEVDDGDTSALRTSTCMSMLALDEELLVERDYPEWVNLSPILFIILQNQPNNKTRGTC